MGINKINCEGYADVKGSGFGKEHKNSSDFDGTDLLKSGAILAAIAAGSSVAGCLEKGCLEKGNTGEEGKNYLFNGTEPKDTETVPVQIVNPIHISEFAFGKVGEMGEIRNGFTNETYQIKFVGIEREYVPMGRSMMWAYYNANFSITNLNTSETRAIVLEDDTSIDIDRNLSAHIEVGYDYANLSIIEK